MVSAQKLLIIVIIFSLSVPFVFAAEFDGDGLQDTGPIVTVIKQGSTAISDSLASKSTGEKTSLLTTATNTALKTTKYPYLIEKTEITILKYRCTQEICGYWIRATRGGREVYTNSPIWISPPPYQAVVSDIIDTKANTETITITEDPKLAVEQVLQQYVNRQPLGKAVTGTKE